MIKGGGSGLKRRIIEWSRAVCRQTEQLAEIFVRYKRLVYNTIYNFGELAGT